MARHGTPARAVAPRIAAILLAAYGCTYDWVLSSDASPAPGLDASRADVVHAMPGSDARSGAAESGSGSHHPPPPVDAGQHMVDAGTDASQHMVDAGMDSGFGIIILGANCMTGEVAPGPVDAGGGGGSSVYFCDTSGSWQESKPNGCSPAGCLACLEAKCAHMAMGQANCTSEIQWLSSCGPASANYLQMLDGECSQATGGMSLDQCEELSCMGGPTQGDAGNCGQF